MVGPAGPFGRICTVGNVLDILSGWSMAQCPVGFVRFLVALCHNLHNCTAAVQERERNCSRISRNWRQLRVCKSVPPPVVRPWVQDVNFCDAKIERLFLSRKKERCLNYCSSPFILILSTYLKHDLIYSFQNLSTKSGSCAYFFQMCKTCTKRLVPELVQQRDNC